MILCLNVCMLVSFLFTIWKIHVRKISDKPFKSLTYIRTTYMQWFCHKHLGKHPIAVPPKGLQDCAVYISLTKELKHEYVGRSFRPFALYAGCEHLQAIMLYWNLSITLAIIISNAAVHVVWIVIKTFDNPCLMKYCQYLLFSLALLQWHH